ncbi:MAG: patatin, partial [Proteobacteria bacterium]|nr:patatin [Pseudomonadota bacterium]
SSDILKLKSLFAMLRADSISLNDPLAKLTAQYVDDKMLKDIAAEHAKGRRLYIGTTALDAQRPVVWNMGAIAASGHPDAPALFRKIMIASAAVPVAFPPAYFEVEAGGRRYDEMHVDGGVANQVFLYGPMFDAAKARVDLGSEKQRRNFRAFVIRNTRIKPAWEDMTPLIRNIAPRSVSSLIKAQGIGDLYRIYVSALHDGLDFNLAYIPDAMDTNRSDEFDTRVMNVLFDTGYRLASHGYHWFKQPPGLTGAGAGDKGARPLRVRSDETPGQEVAGAALNRGSAGWQ